MADDPSNRGPQDRSRINVNQEHELRYWSKKFAVSAVELKAAVQKVGTSAKDVEKELAANADRDCPAAAHPGCRAVTLAV